jgi:hypothetical protein
MSTTNDLPNKFARTVINELAYIRATVLCMAHDHTDALAAQSNADKTQVYNQFIARVDAKAKSFYDVYVKELGIEPPQTQVGGE